MRLKKLPASVLLFSMLMLFLCGCGGNSTEDASVSAEPTVSAVAASEEAGAQEAVTTSEEPTSPTPIPYNESLGSANTPAGTTLVISVFADDANYRWNFDDSTDQATKERIKEYLGVATDYLTQAIAAYGADARFIYDFDENTDLYYQASFDCDTTTSDAGDAETSMNTFLSENVDSAALREKYQANNVIYLMLINTDEACTGVSCTRNYYDGMENCPAVYAHEMMHCFGDPDLYYRDEEYSFTQEFLDYVVTDMPNDLMYTCSDLETGDYVYDRVTNELSELDAYYAGLTDHCTVVEQFGLGPSQH